MKQNIWSIEQDSGMSIRMIEPISNGLIELKEGQQGRIINCYSQTEATIYFDNIGRFYDDDLSFKKMFNLEPFNHNIELEGLVLTIKRKSYAIDNYEYSPKFYEKLTESRSLLNIPFFKNKEKLKQTINESFTRVNGAMEKNYHYYLEDVIDICEEGFEEWVQKNVTWVELSEENKYYYEYDRTPDQESNEKLMMVKHELELQFAKTTGVWHNFKGGLIWN